MNPKTKDHLPTAPCSADLGKSRQRGGNIIASHKDDINLTNPADYSTRLILMVDVDGSVIHASGDIKIIDVEQLAIPSGISFHQLLHPDCREKNCHLTIAWDEARKRIRQDQGRYDCVFRDSQRGVNLSLEFLPTVIKEPPSGIFAVIIIENLSRKEDIENRLRLVSAELKLLFDAIPHIYLRLNEKGMILDWSARLIDEETLPLRLEKGHFIHYVFPVPVVNQFIKAINQCFQEKSIVKLQYQIPTPQGNLLFDASFMPLDNEIIVMSHDITEKIRLETIAQSVQMMNNLGYIFSGIRHEIGNPINSMKMTMSVLKHNIENYSRDKILEYIDRVLNEIHRVEYLLTSLKNFNMHENLTLKVLPLISFIERLLPLVEEDFRKRGIGIETDIRTAEDSAKADSRALQQVMLNLLSNAADSFLEPDKNPKIVISLEQQGKKLILTVTDNGIGMTQYQLDNLFKPFFTSKPQGTGLGLVIVKKLMMQMDGEIEVESKVDSGTKIRLIFRKDEHE